MRKQLLFLLLFLSAHSYSEQFIPGSFLHQPFYFEAEGLLADFDARVKDGEYEAAVKLLQEGIDKSAFLVVNNKNYEFSSARAVFTGKILKADAAIKNAYLILTDPLAEELFNRALATYSKQDFKNILDSYGAGSYAGRARQYLADYSLAEGDFEAALQYLLALKPPSGQKLFKTALCLEKLGREKEASGVYTELAEKFGTYEIEVDGKKIAAATFASAKATALTGTAKAASFLFKSGAAALKWEALTLPENPFEVSEPVISAGKVLLAADRKFYALEAEWGLTDFQSMPFDNKNIFEPGAFPALCGSGVAAEGSLAAVRFFTSRIACSVYDTEKKETRLYLTQEQLGAEKGKYQKSLNLPAVKGNAVYLGLLSLKEKLTGYYLVKIDRDKGDLKWSVFLGSGNQTEFMFENAPAPVFSGEDLIVETNLFTLACLDRETGIIKWTLGLPPETEIGNDERLEENNPPYRNLLADGSYIFYAPKHKKVIASIEKETGRKIWEISRNYLEHLVGEKNGYLYTADSAFIYRLDKKNGKRSSVFAFKDKGNTGRVSFYRDYFYYPTYFGVGTLDIDGLNFKKYSLSHTVSRVFPFEQGLLVYGEGKVRLYGDKEEVIAGAKLVKENAPEYGQASYCLALNLLLEGKTIEGTVALKKLLNDTGTQVRKEEIKAKLESLELEAAKTAFKAGNYLKSHELLDGLRESGNYQAQVAWLLLECYGQEGGTGNIAGEYEKIIREGKGKYFEPEANLEIAQDYYAGVKLKGIREYFPSGEQQGRRIFDFSSKPLWESKKIISSATVKPFLLKEKLFFAHTLGFSAVELDSGKVSVGSFKAKKKPAEVNYGRYGFYPDSSAGDEAMVYFCMPNNSIYGVEPKTLQLNFEWHPERRINQSFLPNSLAVTGNLLFLHDPFTGILALERNTALKAFEIQGEFSEPSFYGGLILAVEKRTMILRCYDATTGMKKWELNLQAGMQNLEIKSDASFVYIITEEGVLYKIKQINGALLLKNKISGDSRAWDFCPAVQSATAIFISSGRKLYSVDKGLLAVNWVRDTYSTYRSESRPGAKKGQFEISKPVLFVKPEERQTEVNWLYLTGSKLLARTGDYLEVYDAETGKPELWLEKALPLVSKDRFSPVNCYDSNGNLIIVIGGVAQCFKGMLPAVEQNIWPGRKK